MNYRLVHACCLLPTQLESLLLALKLLQRLDRRDIRHREGWFSEDFASFGLRSVSYAPHDATRNT